MYVFIPPVQKDQAGVSEVHVKIKQMAKAAHPEHMTFRLSLY